jgi:hypothetical protein
VNGALLDLDLNDIAFLGKADDAASGGFGGDVTDGETRGSAREPPIGDERAMAAQLLGF